MKSFIAVLAVALAIVAVNGSAYAPSAGLKGVPCPKSVVVSCAPLVQSVPCKSGAGGHLGGAYTEQYPQYAAPQYGAPQYAGQYEEAEQELSPAASEYSPKYAVPRYSPYYKYY